MSPTPTRCPICGRDNRCGKAQGAATCWCETAAVSRAVLDVLAKDGDARACICSECAARAVPSPCIDDCTLDAATQTCRGCRRTMNEIVNWQRSSAAERRAVLDRLRRARES